MRTKYKTLTVCFFLLLSFEVCLGQSSYKGLTPGKSTRTDAERVLGRPVKELSKTLIEYAPQSLTGKIYVQYRVGSVIVERLELVCRLQNSTCDDFTKSLNLNLPQQQDTGTLRDGKWTMLYGPPHFIVMSGDSGTEVNKDSTARLAFYSRELYEAEFVRAEEAIKEAELKAEETRRLPPPLTGGYGEITGIVKVRAADGSSRPLAGATIEFYRMDRPDSRVQTKADQHGIFQYVGLSQTVNWVVVVSGAGVKWTYLDGVRTPVAGLEIVTEAGDGAVPTSRDVVNAVKRN